MGVIIDPRNTPKLIQRLFGKINDLGTKKAKNKNIIEMIIAQSRISPVLIKGYKAAAAKTNENTKPNDFSEDFFIGMLIIGSYINFIIIKIKCVLKKN